MTDKTVKDVVDAWTTHRTKRYRFYIHVTDGVGGNNVVEWTGLKLAEAKTMHRLTAKHSEVGRYGWEEMK